MSLFRPIYLLFGRSWILSGLQCRSLTFATSFALQMRNLPSQRQSQVTDGFGLAGLSSSTGFACERLTPPTKPTRLVFTNGQRESSGWRPRWWHAQQNYRQNMANLSEV